MFIIIYVTHPDQKSAESISNTLLEKRYIACANIHTMESIYWWQGAIEKEGEYVSILKTRKENWRIVKSTIEAIHPYDIPCIMKMEVEANKAYEDWIHDMTKLAMYSSKYSIWLLPEKAVGEKLKEQMTALSKEYSAPIFEPHITLWSPVFGNEFTVSQKMLLLQKEMADPFVLEQDTVASSDTYYQALYYRLKVNENLQKLYALSAKHFPKESVPEFMPHISMLYTDENFDKLPALDNLVPFSVDRIALVDTSSSVNEWRIIEVYKM